MKIGLLSDTHGFLDGSLKEHFSGCDEIWHAGDIGSWEVVDELNSWNIPTRYVYGNIDGGAFRSTFKKDLLFEIAGVKIMITHIGGAMGKYNPEVRGSLLTYKPHLFVCGHSHILKVAFDKSYNVLYMNPGAAGKHGFHIFRTALRFSILDGRISDLEVIELGRRASLEA